MLNRDANISSKAIKRRKDMIFHKNHKNGFFWDNVAGNVLFLHQWLYSYSLKICLM